jgi:hypothetical protein
MTQHEIKHVNAKVFESLDATMPGRRIGSTLPEDCTPAALAALEHDDDDDDDDEEDCKPATRAALERLRDQLPEHLALTVVRHFLQQQGERHDEPFARAFRKEVILEILRAESRKQQ